MEQADLKNKNRC